jgi:hypothetical protein
MTPPLYQLRAFQAAGVLARLLPRHALRRLAPLIGRASYSRNQARAKHCEKTCAP